VGLGPDRLARGAGHEKDCIRGLRLTAVDTGDERQARARQLAKRPGKRPNITRPPIADRCTGGALKDGRFQIIIEATDDPQKILKVGHAGARAGAGIIMLLGRVGRTWERSTWTLRQSRNSSKRNNVLIGSINSARSDFRDAIGLHAERDRQRGFNSSRAC